MKFGSLQSGSGQLQEAAEKLQSRWLDLREVWQDANAVRFEEEELKPLAQSLQIALPAISQMSSAMLALQRGLRDEREQSREGL